jgi:hypothetical protein
MKRANIIFLCEDEHLSKETYFYADLKRQK